MKCRNCDNEAIYEDGLCEKCHRRAVEQGADEPRVQVLSRDERENFQGTTINEDGSVHDAEEDGQGNPHVHIYTSQEGLPFRIKLAAGFIIFVIIAIILAAMSLLVLAGPYLLGGAAILLIYKVIKSLMGR